MKRICVFAGYAPDGKIKQAEIYYLRKLSEISDIIYIADSDIKKDELKKIEKFCIYTKAKRHKNRDFGSYKLGYLYTKKQNLLNNCDELMFVNNGMLGPLFDLKPYMKKMEKTADFWAMCVHYDRRTKRTFGESYFLVFSKKVFMSNTFDKYIESINEPDPKRGCVVYEEGLSETLLKAGFSLSGLLGIHKNGFVYKDKIFPLIKRGFPMLKRQLFTQFTPQKTLYRLEKLKKFAPNFPIENALSIMNKTKDLDLKKLSNIKGIKQKLSLSKKEYWIRIYRAFGTYFFFLRKYKSIPKDHIFKP